MAGNRGFAVAAGFGNKGHARVFFPIFAPYQRRIGYGRRSGGAGGGR